MHKILLSNDDGINAKGLKILKAKLTKIANIVVVAPDRERSTSSHSITLHRPLRIDKAGKNSYIVDGTPSDCVYLGINWILKHTPPDLVISGINHGANLGDDLIYSGTVAAAMEGAILGIPAIAVSLVGNKFRESDLKAGAAFVLKLAKKVLKIGLPDTSLINVNIPEGYAANGGGYHVTKMGRRFYDNLVIEKIDPRKKKYYWIGGNLKGYRKIKESDCNAINDGKISITPIKLDLTDHAYFRRMMKWKV